MEPIHIVLLILGTISFAEALWGISAPTRVQDAVRRAVTEIPARNPGVGTFFSLLAAALWLLLSPEKRLSDWILVVLSWMFAGGAYVNFKAGAFQRMARILILDRHPMTLRLMYFCEMILALGLISVGLLKL